jgi:hypothetical protein
MLVSIRFFTRVGDLISGPGARPGPSVAVTGTGFAPN